MDSCLNCCLRHDADCVEDLCLPCVGQHMQPPAYMSSNAHLRYVVTAATRAHRLVKSGYTFFTKSLTIRKEGKKITTQICLQSEQAYVWWFYLRVNSSWAESFLSHHKTKFLHVKVNLLPWRPLFLKPVTFDHSPHLTVLQHISCVSSWHVLLLQHEGLAAPGCWCCLVQQNNLIIQSTDTREAVVDV